MQIKHVGFVAIIGRPNVGKSTLLNAILKEKISIISKVPQTTRFQIRGVLTEERGQIIFIDTPGLHLAHNQLSKYLNMAALKAKKDADVILYVVDLTRLPGKEEESIIDSLKNSKKPLIMALNKKDKGSGYLNEYINLWESKVPKEHNPLKYYIPISALNSENLDKLLEAIFSLLPESQDFFYPEDLLSDFPLKLNIAEIVREKLLGILKEELPYSIAVLTEEIEHKENIVYIKVNILVERDSQKKIVIGKQGINLKQVGILSRREIEEILEKKIFLEIKVKTEKNWQNNPYILKKLGYSV